MERSRVVYYLPEIEYDELQELEYQLSGRTDEEIRKFAQIYRGRRKDAQTTLILALVGLFGFAGLHRLVNGDIGMGILYLVTGGLCLIGTIIDMVNYKKLNLEANRKIMQEVMQYSFY